MYNNVVKELFTTLQVFIFILILLVISSDLFFPKRLYMYALVFLCKQGFAHCCATSSFTRCLISQLLCVIVPFIPFLYNHDVA